MKGTRKVKSIIRRMRPRLSVKKSMQHAKVFMKRFSLNFNLVKELVRSISLLTVPVLVIKKGSERENRRGAMRKWAHEI